ncbi:nuclear GTP-binding protein [Fistulifera solaris]|uniref:Nuclear GTP-binding protein n=1 Tax=Fistulifera solaris TaxID=1519565 RepID=A0A1Z5K453_FISSO|nr:nuclear GTP-binding protein [Fistulifera solaris]|eukprot:GAX20986.1 nuclear GTP-binding protein [Fistulifera solaris]
MVKKKGKSKRTTLQDKYKIQKRTLETHRKRKKQSKQDAANGVIRHGKSKNDPGIPNSWPFKQDLLKEIQRQRERQQQLQAETKERRKSDLRALRAHQEQGGTARTVQELMEQANQDKANFEAKEGRGQVEKEKSDGTVAAGQQSRRAYLRELRKVVDTADVLLQVLDARDPLGSRIHPSVEDALLSHSDKRMVLVLNKIDLVPKEVVGSWLTYLRRSHPTIAIKASSVWGSTTIEDEASSANSATVLGMDGLLQLLKNYARTGGSGGKSKTAIVVGIIGYPNVGKSSIINALKRTRSVGVSPRPGFTTSMQEVVLDRNVRLLDSPGVVFDDRSAMLGNCVDAESIEDPIPAVAALLQRCNHESLLMTYSIPAFPPGDVMMFLAMVARSFGRVLKGGIPDKVAAARAVLKDWNHGKIPFYTVPPRNSGPEKANDAKIISKFTTEFDLSKFDAEVLNHLGEMDEMDFVKLEDAGKTIEMGEASKDAIQFFSNGDTNSSDDEMTDHTEMEDDGDKDIQQGLASAEDYDFSTM